MKKLARLAEKLADSRGREVLFISHCILNVNTRYLGGAFRRGAVDEILAAAMRRGTGLVQMKCPEQHAWGGVSKPAIWLAFGSKGTPAYAFWRVLAPVFRWHTSARFRRMARSVAREIRDYVRSGYTVVGIVGVDGSPTCGVNKRLSIQKTFDYFSGCDHDCLRPAIFNDGLYRQCSEEGPGLFIRHLARRLHKTRWNIPIIAHSLVSEMRGEESPAAKDL